MKENKYSDSILNFRERERERREKQFRPNHRYALTF